MSKTGAASTRIISVGAGAVGVAAILSWLGLALVHIDDNFHVDHIAGVWMGLTAYASDGVLYPPLYDDGVFAGTRYAPLGIAANYLAAEVGGEYLVSGKIVSLLTMAVLLGIVYAIAREEGCGRPIALAVTGAVIAAFTVSFAGTSIYGDALAAALQLGAIWIIARRTDGAAAAVAGVLAALAVSAKISGLWGGAAVLIWLLLRERRSIVPFGVAAAATLALVFGLAAILSDGRVAENLLGLGGSGFEGIRELLVETPEKIWTLMVDNALVTAILLPFAAASSIAAAIRGQAAVVDVALLVALPLTLVVMTDVGTGFNHLLDLAVLVPLAAAAGYRRAGRQVVALALVGLLAVASAVSLVESRGDVREAARIVLDGETPERLQPPALAVPIERPYFSEDPTIPVQRGEQPVALDSFMLLRIAERHPAWADQLEQRFDRREFGTVILITDLELDDPWWRDSHLGIELASAIDRNYRAVDEVPGPTFKYRILEPRPGERGGPTRSRDGGSGSRQLR